MSNFVFRYNVTVNDLLPLLLSHLNIACVGLDQSECSNGNHQFEHFSWILKLYMQLSHCLPRSEYPFKSISWNNGFWIPTCLTALMRGIYTIHANIDVQIDSQVHVIDLGFLNLA